MNINHTKMTLEINSCKNYEILEVRQGDKGTRIIDFAFTVNGETVNLASTMSAKVNATVDDVIVADSVAAVVDTENNVVTVTLTDTMLALSGICKMDIVLMEGDEIITAETVCLRVGKSVINDDSKAFPGASSIVEITKEVENARGSQNSLGARLDTVDSNLTKKANKSDVDSINSRLQSAEQNLRSKANATDVSNALKSKEDNLNKVSSKTDITDSSTNYPSIKYLNDYYYDANESYSSAETDELLGNKADKATTLVGYGITDAYTKNAVDASLVNKANRINSSNIFDFDTWAKGLQNLNKPVYNGTLDVVDFDEKSITFTSTGTDTSTNGWVNEPAEMRIAVKSNTVYTFSWLFENSTKNRIFLFFNGQNTAETRLTEVGSKAFLTFTTPEDASYITIRFDSYNQNIAAKVSNIMIEEGDKKSLYLPYEVAEGVPEVANEVLTFEKTTQTSLANKYDSSNIESGTSTLTPYSTITDKIKSASCVYKTIGDVVIISATVKMNAVTIGASSAYLLIDLPYKCISADDVFCVGISNLGKIFKFSVPKNNTWLQFSTQDKTAYTFADGERINVICLYKIK